MFDSIDMFHPLIHFTLGWPVFPWICAKGSAIQFQQEIFSINHTADGRGYGCFTQTHGSTVENGPV